VAHEIIPERKVLSGLIVDPLRVKPAVGVRAGESIWSRARRTPPRSVAKGRVAIREGRQTLGVGEFRRTRAACSRRQFTGSGERLLSKVGTWSMAVHVEIRILDFSQA